jgi:phage shock protein PspC (stress-responsive transcriptional regulator)
MNKKLYRDEFHQKIGGVCAGLAEYFEADVTLIRVLFVFFGCMSVGVLVYFVLWIVLPKKMISVYQL